MNSGGDAFTADNDQFRRDGIDDVGNTDAHGRTAVSQCLSCGDVAAISQRDDICERSGAGYVGDHHRVADRYLWE